MRIKTKSEVAIQNFKIFLDREFGKLTEFDYTPINRTLVQKQLDKTMDILENTYNIAILTKYLKDELGFEERENPKVYLEGQFPHVYILDVKHGVIGELNNRFEINFNPNNAKIIVGYLQNHTIDSEGEILFNGKITTTSELFTLLKQLEIL